MSSSRDAKTCYVKHSSGHFHNLGGQYFGRQGPRIGVGASRPPGAVARGCHERRRPWTCALASMRARRSSFSRLRCATGSSFRAAS
eukprot:1713844-Pleurochrysis_carterae.AAC.1